MYTFFYLCPIRKLLLCCAVLVPALRLLITALQALQAAGLLKDMNVIAYFTGDEERSGTPHYLARKDFIDRVRTCDFALGFESAGGLDHVVAARRGASSIYEAISASTGRII